MSVNSHRLRSYPAYRPSGTAVARPPMCQSHWEMRALRNVIAADRRAQIDPDLPLLSVVRERGVILFDYMDINSVGTENHMSTRT